VLKQALKGNMAMILSAHIIRQLSILAARIVLPAAIAITAIGLFGGDARAIPTQGQPLVEAAINKQGTLGLAFLAIPYSIIFKENSFGCLCAFTFPAVARMKHAHC